VYVSVCDISVFYVLTNYTDCLLVNFCVVFRVF